MMKIEVLDFILYIEMSDSKYAFLYLQNGLWKAYARSARALSAMVEKGIYSVEALPSHDMELEILTLTPEYLIESGLVDRCYSLEDDRLVLEI